MAEESSCRYFYHEEYIRTEDYIIEFATLYQKEDKCSVVSSILIGFILCLHRIEVSRRVHRYVSVLHNAS